MENVATRLLRVIISQEEDEHKIEGTINDFRLWLLHGGGSPSPMHIPEECAHWLRRYRRDRLVTANFSHGILMFDSMGRTRILVSWGTAFSHLHEMRRMKALKKSMRI